jgi:hypothetical protein
MRKTLACLLFLFCSALGWGQNSCHGVNPEMCTNYTVGNLGLVAGEPSYSFGDNFPNAKAINVWHLMSGSPSLIGFTSGYQSKADGSTVTHYGWTSAGQAWQYIDFTESPNPNTWVQIPAFGTNIKAMAMVTGLTFSLQTYAPCPTGSYGIFYWNGSAWIRPGTGCVSQLGGGQDGTLMGVGTDGFLYESLDNSASWAQVTASGSGWKYVTPANVGEAFAVKTDGTIWVVALPSGTLTELSGLTTAPPAVDSDGNAFVVGTDSNIYHLNSSNLWDKLIGTGFSYINTCGSLCTFGVQSSGNTYRFPDISMTAIATESGSTACTPSCPPNITHKKTLTVRFSHGSLGGQTTVGPSEAPGSGVTIQAADTTWDLFWCVDQPNTCFAPGSIGSVACTAVGLIFSNSVGPFLGGGSGAGWKTAYARHDLGTHQQCGFALLGRFACGNNGHKGCIYGTQGPPNWTYWCNDLGQSPDYDGPYNISDCNTNAAGTGPPTGMWGFDQWGKCYYSQPAPHAPSICFWNYATGSPTHQAEVYGAYGTRGQCTFNEVTQ